MHTEGSVIVCFIHHLEKNHSESDSNNIVFLCLYCNYMLWCGLCYSLILRMIFRTIIFIVIVLGVNGALGVQTHDLSCHSCLENKG